MEIKSRVPGKIVRFEKQIGDSVETGSLRSEKTGTYSDLGDEAF